MSQFVDLKPSTNGKPQAKPTTRHGRIKTALSKAAVDEPKNITELAEKIEEDPQFLLGRLVIEALIVAAPITLEAEPETPAAVALAESLEAAWQASVNNALRCIGHGRAAFEIRYGEYDRSTGIRPLKCLDYLETKYTSMRLLEGRYDGIDLVVPGAPKVVIDAAASWWCAIGATAQHPHGVSKYLGAPLAVWKERRVLDRQYAVWQKKFALGNGIAYGPSEYAPNSGGRGPAGEQTNSGDVADPLEAMVAAVQRVESGGTMVMPSDTDANGNRLFQYDPPSTKIDATPLENRTRQLDAKALRSLGIPERAITQDDATGSYAMAQVHWDVLKATCEGIRSQMVASFEEHVIRKAIVVNFGEGSQVKIKVTAAPIIDNIKAVALRILEGAAIAGTVSPLLSQGVLDLDRLIQTAGLPAGQDLPAALERLRTSAAAPIGPPAPAYQLDKPVDDVPDVPTQEDLERFAAEEAKRILADMAASELRPGAFNWRSLRRS